MWNRKSSRGGEEPHTYSCSLSDEWRVVSSGGQSGGRLCVRVTTTTTIGYIAVIDIHMYLMILESAASWLLLFTVKFATHFYN